MEDRRRLMTDYIDKATVVVGAGKGGLGGIVVAIRCCQLQSQI